MNKINPKYLEVVEKDLKKANDLMDFAYTIMCNVRGGNLHEETEDWIKAFNKFQNDFFQYKAEQSKPLVFMELSDCIKVRPEPK